MHEHACREFVGVNNGVNLDGQSSSRMAHMFLSISRDAGSVLVPRTTDASIICRRIMSRGQRIHDPIPDVCPPPPDEALVASRGRPLSLIRMIRRSSWECEATVITILSNTDQVLVVLLKT